jgi:phenylalanyl-tRNA synthetase beta chain
MLLFFNARYLMKLSISWIFDHIDADWRILSLAEIVSKFNNTVAEIEGYTQQVIDIDSIACARVSSISHEISLVTIPEWSLQTELPFRNDIKINQWYMVKNSNGVLSWAQVEDLFGYSNGIMPAFNVQPYMAAGDWKNNIQREDYIVDIDNKSINHRPDLWSHRGIAREIAAMFDLRLKPLDQFLSPKRVVQFSSNIKSEITTQIQSSLCDRFASLYFEDVAYQATSLWMGLRLMRIGVRAINVLVDISNYVMFDLGQPLHTYDADMLTAKKIIVRNAYAGEKLELLKGEQVTLSLADLVIADGNKPISLAGIRGGRESGVRSETKRLFLESAHFDAGTIRQTSIRLKLRTEASARFEKNIDPCQVSSGIMRFIALLDHEGIKYCASEDIVEIGSVLLEKHITVLHQYIEDRLGVSLDQEAIIDTLKKLEFGVECNQGVYSITVPTFRATKDVSLPEDIVEEVGRFFGYTNIPYQVPMREMKPFDVGHVMRRRAIKKFFAFACNMKEVANYAFYDERFLTSINWYPQRSVRVANPQSENWQRLVTSLIPHLLKNVVDNKDYGHRFNFFEWARRWCVTDSGEHEQQVISGVLFDKKASINFYDGKEIISRLCLALGFSFEWQAIDRKAWAENDNVDIYTPCYRDWFDSDQVAYITHAGHRIGIAGKISIPFLHHFIEGDAFLFEINADYINSVTTKNTVYKPISKYPSICRDLSILVPLSITVEHIKSLISSIDQRITHVTLIDFFQKKDWVNQKSLAFSITITDENKTLTHQDADYICDRLKKELEHVGAVVR